MSRYREEPPVPEHELPDSAVTATLLAFFVGPEEYVVDLGRVLEILTPVPVLAVPHTPGFIEGVAHLRTGVVPVLNARLRLGAKPPAPKLKEKLLVHRLGERRVATRVDGVTEVVRAARTDLRPSPSLQAPGGRSFVLGVCSAGGKMRLLLDVRALWQSDP